MKLYVAGGLTGKIDKVFVRNGLRWRLLTYFEIRYPSNASYWLSGDAPAPLFVDSGAFSAHTRGLDVDIREYCDFLNLNKDHIDPYAALDVIGDWKASAQNYEFMLTQGLKPIPTFHMQSPMHELRRLLGVADYIALGGLVGCHTNVLKVWLDKCWVIIKEFWPKRIHAFGLTSPWLLLRYPWYSADSSTAVFRGGMGIVNRWKDTKVTQDHFTVRARKTMDGSILDHVCVGKNEEGSAHVFRRLNNINNQISIQRYVTDVWALRGIVWQ